MGSLRFEDELDAELQRLGPEMAGKTLVEVQAAVAAKVEQVMERCAPTIAATPMAEIIPEIDPADPTRLKLTVLPRPLLLAGDQS